MVITCKNVANAVGAKTARACDSCIRKRARWYCAADDAFLCQGCDASVHSANPLARRHERVRLKTSSSKTIDEDSQENSVPSWHKGFTRKARTPRYGKAAFHQTSKGQDSMLRNGPFPLVPEIGFDHTSPDENDQDQLLYRVPIFDPFVAELCNSTTTSEAETAAATTVDVTNEGQISDDDGKTRESKVGNGNGVYNFHGFLPTDMDLAEFAADVESLLGRGLENESFDMEGLGLIDCKEKGSMECSLSSGRVVKLEEEEEEEEAVNNTDFDMTREPFELNFDYDSPVEEEEEEKVAAQPTAAGKISSGEYNEEDGDAKKKSIKKRKNIQLRLDYEGVITAWASQGSPWTTGSRPEFDPDNCWPDCMGTCGTEVHHPYGEMSVMGGHTTMGDGGRQARVSRYREKRRTRLFSKKIRYEVRKLNAEKRPRMKGRFVKRTSFAAPGFPLISK